MDSKIEINRDSMVYQLHDMLDRFCSMGAAFGFGTVEIIKYLQRKHNYDAELNRAGQDINKFLAPMAPEQGRSDSFDD